MQAKQLALFHKLYKKHTKKEKQNNTGNVYATLMCIICILFHKVFISLHTNNKQIDFYFSV